MPGPDDRDDWDDQEPTTVERPPDAHDLDGDTEEVVLPEAVGASPPPPASPAPASPASESPRPPASPALEPASPPSASRASPSSQPPSSEPPPAPSSAEDAISAPIAGADSRAARSAVEAAFFEGPTVVEKTRDERTVDLPAGPPAEDAPLERTVRLKMPDAPPERAPSAPPPAISAPEIDAVRPPRRAPSPSRPRTVGGWPLSWVVAGTVAAILSVLLAALVTAWIAS